MTSIIVVVVFLWGIWGGGVAGGPVVVVDTTEGFSKLFSTFSSAIFSCVALLLPTVHGKLLLVLQIIIILCRRLLSWEVLIVV